MLVLIDADYLLLVILLVGVEPQCSQPPSELDSLVKLCLHYEARLALAHAVADVPPSAEQGPLSIDSELFEHMLYKGPSLGNIAPLANSSFLKHVGVVLCRELLQKTSFGSQISVLDC